MAVTVKGYARHEAFLSVRPEELHRSCVSRASLDGKVVVELPFSILHDLLECNIYIIQAMLKNVHEYRPPSMTNHGGLGSMNSIFRF